MKIDRLAAVVGIVTALTGGSLLAGLIAAYNHFAKADDITIIAGRLDTVEERLLKQRQEQIDTLRIQREERKLNPDPRWLRQRQRQLDYERCLYKKRFDRRVHCTR